MEALFFFAGVTTVSVLLALGWVLKVVTVQVKQFRKLEDVVESVTRDIITENDVRAIVDSRVDKFAASIEREIAELRSDNDREFSDVYTSVSQNVEMLIRGDEQLKRELMDQININRVTNNRNVTNGDLQTEY